MKVKSILIVAMLICIATSTYSQGKFGKPAIEELQLIESDIDKEAEAEFLSKTCEIFFTYNENLGFTKNRKVTAKLKIYDKDKAEDWANIVISLYGEEDMTNLKAFTHNLEEGKIKTEKLGKDQIFTEELDENWTRERFTFPNVKDGSILEWSYTISSPYVRITDVWYFQHSIPVKYSSFDIITPGYFTYLPHFTGFESPVEISESNGTDGMLIGLIDYSYTTTNTTIVYKDIPPLKKENFVFNINNYRNSVRYELVRTSLPQQTVKQYSATWEVIAEQLMNDEEFGLQLDKSHYYKNDLNDIVADTVGKGIKDQTRHIFNYVQRNIRWNNGMGLYTDKGVKKAFDTKSGNSAEINLMLVSMLRSAGLNANPLVLSTVDNGMIGLLFPSKSKLNFVIAAVENGDKLYLMDASNKYSNLNILPAYCLNYTGIIIYKDNSHKVVSVENSCMTESVSIICELNDKSEIEGAYSIKEGGLGTISRREDLVKSEEVEIEKLHKSNSNIIKEEISFENVKDINSLLITSFKFTDNTNIQEIGGKLFISPLLFVSQKENPFKSENRLFAVEIGNRIKETCQLVLKIPEGYEIEYLPESVKYKMLDKMGDYTFMLQQINKEIHITKVLRLNRPIYSAEEAKMLRNLFLKIVEKEDEKIVLVKSE